nr:helix-turn-helix domain-containing protein [Mesorhizobium silamurunense]
MVGAIEPELGRADRERARAKRPDDLRKRARHMLIASSVPIVEVATACGFVSASHFSKCYRELYAQTPQQERLERKYPAAS